MLKATLLVMIGGAIGAGLRFHAGRIFASWSGLGSIPVATLLVNIIGGLLMGALMAFLIRNNNEISSGAEGYHLLLGVGLLGGFTTFSAFSLEMAMMIERGEWMGAFTYAFISVILALIALFIGMAAVRWAL